jgi:DDE domain
MDTRQGPVYIHHVPIVGLCLHAGGGTIRSIGSYGVKPDQDVHCAPLGGHHRPGTGLSERDRGLDPAALHNTGQYENNRVESDHGRLKARLRPMRGLKTNRTASVVIRGHAFIQNLRRGHYELAVDTGPLFRLAIAFDELRPAI